MSRVTKKVEKWLVSVIQPQYVYKDVAYSHVYYFLTKYLPQGFKIRTAVYTSDLGIPQLLINLNGSLSTQTELIQLSIWIPHNYPYADDTHPHGDANGVPLVYVVPTSGNTIRPSNNIDAQGKVYHPYLAQWHSKMYAGVTNNEFLLINLMNVLGSTFSQFSPIGSSIISQGPQLPPKPQMYRDSSLSLTPLPQREFTGPALPEKPSLSPTPVDSTPERYRAPPPLPTQMNYNSHRVSSVEPQYSGSNDGYLRREKANSASPDPNHARTYSHQTSIPQENSIHKEQLDYVQLPYAKDEFDQRKATSVPSPRKQSVEDLMDKVTLQDNSVHNTDQLERLAIQINAFLDPNNEESVDHLIPQINEYTNRVMALQSQLEHHSKQAHANLEMLDSHVKYLEGRIGDMKDFNEELEKTEKLNTTGCDLVFINSSRSMPLDELVTLDLILLHQLYDVCSDIKAHKDALSLVGGNFKSQGELITDSNLDSCVKAIRSLSRDLFWLEVTRGEIAKSMGLDDQYN